MGRSAVRLRVQRREQKHLLSFPHCIILHALIPKLLIYHQFLWTSVVGVNQDARSLWRVTGQALSSALEHPSFAREYRTDYSLRDSWSQDFLYRQ